MSTFLSTEPVCARDANAQECGAAWSNFEKCCDGYICGGDGNKKCVKTSDKNVCAIFGKNAMECGMCPNDFPNKEFGELRSICCEGFVCAKDHTPLMSAICIKRE